MVTGARPRRTRVTGVEALTARELRVAQLAVEGLTNRQIAQALFVSQPTVATHLSHCYQKLDINSREQLPTALAQSQADDP
ncbi:MAG: helix-turn-helix transcriptional regulator [Solirubrobacterales bacterium]|nr:helix-turn-helix transcriptional regulator [Solirubrobacterales bacterium]